MCKVIYEADDGKQFNNKEECEKYNKIPTIWVVLVIYGIYGIYGSKSISKVFSSKHIAELYMNKEMKRNQGNSIEYNIEPHKITQSLGGE